jgi:peptidyl-dipeptidase A
MSLRQFLESFIPQLQEKSKAVNLATWELETTGSEESAALKTKLETEFRLLLSDKQMFRQLKTWAAEPTLSDPLLKRQLNVLIRMCMPNLVSRDLLEKITQQEATLSLLYSNFRPEIKGKQLSENAIREILVQETNMQVRKDAWEASKQIGAVLAPHTLNLVRLRNEAAQSLGYAEYFSMQLGLQEVDESWLFALLDDLSKKSEAAYVQVVDGIQEWAAKQYTIPKQMVGPWAWSEPFCQEDPIDVKEVDTLVLGVYPNKWPRICNTEPFLIDESRDPWLASKSDSPPCSSIDIVESARQFYRAMHINVDEVLARSDNYERQGKNQHACCINIDRGSDIRMINNVKPTIKWLETVLHELGHAIYELGISPKLPWLLKEPPHMITTEAIALLAGRQAYRSQSLEQLVPHPQKSLVHKAEKSMKRRQLIFCRWVLVMTYFERELYRNPEQDLQGLWWKLVRDFQKIESKGSFSHCDWAAKYHISLAPVYYFSYLLGELFASTLEAKITQFASKETGDFLKKSVFHPGNRFHWGALIEQSTGKPLTADDWISQFASTS